MSTTLSELMMVACLRQSSNKELEAAFVNAIKENDVRSIRTILDTVTKAESHDLIMETRYDDHVDNFSYGPRASHVAAAHGSLDVLRLLIEKYKANTKDKKDIKQNHPINYAIAAGHVNVVEYLKGRCLLIEYNEVGYTPVHVAAVHGQHSILEILLDHDSGIPIDLTISQDNKTMLMLAAASQSLECVELLLRRGANTNIKSKTKETALHFAVRAGGFPVVQRLLELADLKVNQADRNGNTALHEAAIGLKMHPHEQGRREIMQCLLEDERIDQSLKNKEGKAAAEIAGDAMESSEAAIDNASIPSDSTTEAASLILTDYHSTSTNHKRTRETSFGMRFLAVDHMDTDITHKRSKLDALLSPSTMNVGRIKVESLIESTDDRAMCDDRDEGDDDASTVASTSTLCSLDEEDHLQGDEEHVDVMYERTNVSSSSPQSVADSAIGLLPRPLNHDADMHQGDVSVSSKLEALPINAVPPNVEDKELVSCQQPVGESMPLEIIAILRARLHQLEEELFDSRFFQNPQTTLDLIGDSLPLHRIVLHNIARMNAAITENYHKLMDTDNNKKQCFVCGVKSKDSDWASYDDCQQQSLCRKCYAFHNAT